MSFIKLVRISLNSKLTPFTILTLALSCGKSTNSSDAKLKLDQNKVHQGTGDVVAKKDDDLQNQINKLNDKVDRHYTEFSSFKEYAKEEFRKLYDKLSSHDKVLNLEELALQGNDNLVSIIKQLRSTVGTLRSEVTNLNDKTTKHDSQLSDLGKSIDTKVSELETKINASLAKMNKSTEAFRLTVEKSSSTSTRPFSAEKEKQLQALLLEIPASEKDSYVAIAESSQQTAVSIEQKLAGLKNHVGELSLAQKNYQTCLSLSLEVVTGSAFTKYDELESCFNALTEQEKLELSAIRSSVQSIVDKSVQLEKTQAQYQKDFQDYKKSAAETFATKSEVADLRLAVQKLEKANTLLYTSIKTVDAKYEGKIKQISETVEGLRKDFSKQISDMHSLMQSQEKAIELKLALLEKCLRSGQAQLAEKIQDELEEMAKEFGSSLNEMSFALNEKMEGMKISIGMENQELKDQLGNLRNVQLEQQKATGRLAEKMGEILDRLSTVEAVAKKALAVSESNTRAIDLLKSDFIEQSKAVAARFKVTESKVQSLEKNLEDFKDKTNERFKEVEKNAASLVAHLDSKMQSQFSKVSGDLAKLKAQADATQSSVGSLFLKVESIEGRTDYLSKLVQFQNLYKSKLNLSMDGIKAALIAMVDVETEFVKALAVSKQNTGEFDSEFRARLNVQDKCGIEPADLDFARAADVDYFSWLARVYVRDLAFGVRTATTDVDGIFFGKERLIEKDSLAEMLFLNMTAFQGKKEVPAGCFAAIDAFAKEAHFGSGSASQALRTKLIQSELKERIAVLESRMANVSGSLGQLETWLNEQAKDMGVSGDDIPSCKHDLARAVYEQAKTIIDIDDKRAEFRKISELSIAVATQNMELAKTNQSVAEQKAFAESIKKELNALALRLEVNVTQITVKITELQASTLESDKKLVDGLKAQKQALENQKKANADQIAALEKGIQEDISQAKASIESSMKKQFDAFEDTLEGIQAEQMSYGIPNQKQDVAINALFSIVATLAARSGSADLLSATILASENFSGSAPKLLEAYLPKVSLVQHYFSSGFVRGSANACLSLDEKTIQRSPWSFACNVNFRSLSNDQRVGTASSGALRIHGQFQGVVVEAWRSNTWSWAQAVAPTVKTFGPSEYQVPGANLANVPSLTKVAGPVGNTGFGDSGVFDVPNAGQIFSSLIDNKGSQFNGLIKVTPFRPSYVGEVAPTGGSIVNQRLYTSTFNYIVGLYSPLVLKFDNQALETVLPSQSRVNFDMNDNGIQEKTGWIFQATAGFLALPNDKGEITSGAQLFGQATRIGARRARNGYEALAQFDTSNKGFVNASDPVFSKLVVWFDGNQDGVAQPSEMKSLKEMGVTRIDTKFQELPNHLAKQGSSPVDVNMIKYQSKFYGPKSCTNQECQSYDVYFGAVEITQAKK
jgi:hypothetical protein